MHRLAAVIAVALSVPLSSAAAQTTYQLSSGTGPGTMRVIVDGFGSWGGCFPPVGDLFFDSAPGASVATTCGSTLLLHELTAGAPRPFCSYITGNFPAPLPLPAITVLVPNRDISATWTFNTWSIVCRQTVHGPDPADGSTLVQTYTITNTDVAAHTVDIARWLDTDLGVGWQQNRSGATASLASLVTGTPPFTGNGHAAFAWDPILNFAMLCSMEIVGANGLAVENDKWGTFDNTNGNAWLTIGTSAAGALANSVVPDAGGDLINDTAMDVALGVGRTALTIPPSGFITVVTRTRCSFLDAANPLPLSEQARNLSGTAFLGSYVGAGVQSMLCINGSGGVSAVTSGTALTVSLAPPSGLPPSPYLLFAAIGSPTSGNVCGSVRTLDAARWGAPFINLGYAAFPVAVPGLASWTGGGAVQGFLLSSDLPGLGLVTSGPSGGGFPCGSPVLGPVVLGTDAVITLQALVADATSPLGISLSNAPTVVHGNCNLPQR